MVSMTISSLFFFLAVISPGITVARKGFSIPDIPTSEDDAIIFGYVVAGMVGLVVFFLIVGGIGILLGKCCECCCEKKNAVEDAEAAQSRLPAQTQLTLSEQS